MGRDSLPPVVALLVDGQGTADDTVFAALVAAVRLELRRVVAGVLLEGKSQATIAHVLGVHEGTMSRLRAQAIDALWRRLRD
ncbi:MAG: hypothetical protein FJ284_02060 [Planctomycetes bacterium]|nr:hypothetical protein [Planctomycetota bacterium]MBM4058799.1 hypothetical protein [Planctomycetota bacterium]